MSDSIRAPLCAWCKHLDSDLDATRMKCKAFPKGIPQRFLDGKAEHLHPVPGDGGFRFEPTAKAPEAVRLKVLPR